jgi:hypothetical protein
MRVCCLVRRFSGTCLLVNFDTLHIGQFFVISVLLYRVLIAVVFVKIMPVSVVIPMKSVKGISHCARLRMYHTYVDVRSEKAP